MSDKSRYWWAILYPENMIDNWQDSADLVLQLPYCYIIHDKDNISHPSFKEEATIERKIHIHMMIAFNNTTTYKHALEIFNSLSIPGKVCCNTCKAMYNIKSCYDYLIHDTEASKKAGKHLYLPEERIEGNNFDLGAYISVSQEEKDECLFSIYELIKSSIDWDYPIFNIGCLTTYFYDKGFKPSDLEFQIIKGYKGLIVEWCKYVYFARGKKDNEEYLKLLQDLQEQRYLFESKIAKQEQQINKLLEVLNLND